MEYPAHTGYNFTQTLHNDIYPAIDPTKSNLSQPGKVVLITGSGRGIGCSIALRFAESGVACIILCARTASEIDSVEQSIKKINAHVKVRKYVVDITNEVEVVAMAEAVRKEEGRLDALINNAGMSNNWELITVGDTDMYLKTWDLHIKGTYLMLKSFLSLLVETAKNHNVTVDVINTTSVAAHFAVPGASAYQASKFALIRLSEFVVSEYGEQGVNCLSLHPGATPTGIMKDPPPIVVAAMIDTPELCAGTVVWLTKGQRAWLNGRYVSSTWDVDELEAKKDEIVKGDKLKLPRAKIVGPKSCQATNSGLVLVWSYKFTNTFFIYAAVLAFLKSVIAQTAGFDPILSPTGDQTVVAGSSLDIVWQPSSQYTGAISIQLLQGATPSAVSPGIIITCLISSNIRNKNADEYQLELTVRREVTPGIFPVTYHHSLPMDCSLP
ncbi:hypothetical protein G7Y89_g6211 [Cudoniella acicularis]|uniref:Uncharacterized protein n=1 Tax=Cudoniella acicularis TaxID=354080 RepID=A0A8H4RL02_9HELO|nr:hypothetical protein G7Y89_g6211 [Cudoniella acicularis]